MAQCLEERPDQTAMELLVEFQARYPGTYSLQQLYTLQKRVRMWRQQAVQRLLRDVSSNILGEATGNEIT
jgi:predicted PP-loop superfamily ATPase